jgi:hypothetical protein
LLATKSPVLVGIRQGQIDHLAYERIQLGIGYEEAKSPDLIGRLLPDFDLIASPPKPVELDQARIVIRQ